MMEETFKYKLDIYYVATIVYALTVMLYVAITGTLIDERFELVWKDPIVYLLVICLALALITLAIAALLKRRVVIGEDFLVFRTRFRERRFRSNDVAWIAFRREPTKVRGGRAYPIAVIKLQGRRRRLRLRPGAFEQGERMIRGLAEWAERNQVSLHKRRRRKKRQGTGRDGAKG